MRLPELPDVALLARDGIHDALRARPPLSLLAYADRLVLASIADPLDEKTRLLSRAGAVVDHARTLAGASAIFGELTTLMVVTALFVEEGAPHGEELRVLLAPYCLAARNVVERRGEPERSVYLHWQERAGLGKPFPIGDAPVDEESALYHHAHVVFFASRYGARPLKPRAEDAGARAAFAHARALLSRLEDPNSDCIAQVLLANECVRPVDEGLREALRAALGDRQAPDGTLDMPDEADPDARHHALVVTALALALAGDD